MATKKKPRKPLKPKSKVSDEVKVAITKGIVIVFVAAIKKAMDHFWK
jgi:hypothetical protein